MFVIGNVIFLCFVLVVIGIVLCECDVLFVCCVNFFDVGCWGFFGGKIELGELFVDVVVCEIVEEMMIDVEVFDVFIVLDVFDYDVYGVVC